MKIKGTAVYIETDKGDFYLVVLTKEQEYAVLDFLGQMCEGVVKIHHIANYMPSGKWYQLYENVSEPTALSPPFKTKKELIEWLSENNDFNGHRWGKEGAEQIVRDGYNPSGVLVSGRFYKAE